ncbi:SCP2 sterol-binding domain-containing protein [Sporomusa acidovorans]|uniref:Epoxyqueuosine reductase n=2 Tax=Sporomusa TaxID=2375 RepID=A0ABZ3J0F4_SPOA4|nr:SCP2 sterol-binding domain-containing protein [Sporomusa acidovorans]OZC13359.1 epoxyqueuosine reductase [Sporomusa acidovorans DSM 3132]SDF53048.1 Epoxyqueuosine reductase QueG (queuosine biosynthesis) [Sporomusa acidovorans]
MKTVFDQTKLADTNDHPSIKRYNERKASTAPQATGSKLNAVHLREMCLALGADDVGFVEIDRPALADQKADILNVFPWTKALISFVGRINRENLRSPARSIASHELHQVEERLNHAAHALVAALERKGIRAVAPAAGFPMEMDQWPGKLQISYKPIAVAAGLGKMGLHRLLIHPVFGSFVQINTVLIDTEVDEYSSPLTYNPCLDCKICSAACPTGAIGTDGVFNFMNCITHTYRELLGGFSDWVENVADSKNGAEYRSRVSDAETVSLWQSMTYKPCYKSVYCMAVCPAGDEVIPQYLADKSKFIETVVKPLQQKTETVYVLPGSDAESHVLRRFPHKKIKRVGNGIRPASIAAFIASMPLGFQRHKSEGLCATYHFTFTGNESIEATVVIKDKTIQVNQGHVGVADVQVNADAKTWLRVLHKETSILKEIIFRRIRIKGSMKLFKAFGECFA